MAFDFPSTPTTGQTYSVSGGPTYIYDGTAWKVMAAGSGLARTAFTATAGQTTFSATYIVGYVDVYRNGIKLPTADYTATDGTSIILANGCNVGDTVEIVTSPMITYADAIKRTGDTMTGALNIPGSGISSGSHSNNIVIAASNTITSQGTAIIAWGKDMTTWGGDIHYITDSRGAGGSHRYFTWNGTSWITSSVLDGSGRKTLPYQPFFFAYATNSVNYTTSGAKISVHDVAIHNVGNHYNTSTFRFTAPVTGVYYFTARAWGQGGNSTDAGISFLVNGTNYYGLHRVGPTSYFITLVPSIFLKLNAGDYVELFTESASSTGQVHTSSGPVYSNFSGYLVG